ncbi:hypothetical protein BHE74_00044229 [Ensete ventricosum]|nr:hypothetical protein BHE74_00044229 [Ensete ventricosum]RZS13555.1 hypothetical protein BHM03_00045159 [Ensete ventricosum]
MNFAQPPPPPRPLPPPLPHPVRQPPPPWFPPPSRLLYHGHRGDAPLAVFLFPGGRDLGFLAADAAGPPSVLLVFDGTWRQAKELVAASLPFLEQFATRVTLGGCEPGMEGPSTFESELVLRREPFKGCVSTMEAVARALRLLEPDGNGAEVEAALLSL